MIIKISLCRFAHQKLAKPVSVSRNMELAKSVFLNLVVNVSCKNSVFL